MKGDYHGHSLLLFLASKMFKCHIQSAAKMIKSSKKGISFLIIRFNPYLTFSSSNINFGEKIHKIFIVKGFLVF